MNNSRHLTHLLWVVILLQTATVAATQKQDVAIGVNIQATQSLSSALALCKHLEYDGKCVVKSFPDSDLVLDSLDRGGVSFALITPGEQYRAFQKGMINLRIAAFAYRFCNSCPTGMCADQECNCSTANCSEPVAACGRCPRGTCVDPSTCDCKPCGEDTITVQHEPGFVLVTVSGAPDNLVHRAVSTLGGGSPPKQFLWTGPKLQTDAGVPYHPAAEKYLKNTEKFLEGI